MENGCSIHHSFQIIGDEAYIYNVVLVGKGSFNGNLFSMQQVWIKVDFPTVSVGIFEIKF